MGKRIKRQTLDLPDELIGEILIRTPVKSVLRFKCVSKSWRSLISGKGFIREHLETSTDITHHKVILGCSKKINKSSSKACSLKSLLCESGKDLVFVENLDHHPLRNWGCLDMFVRILGSCNGLVLMDFFIKWQDSVLWNPSTREAKKIPCPPFARGRGYKWGYFKYGFGYDDAIDDYKVVWIFSIRRPFQTHIYSCRTNSWREIENFPKVLLLRDSGKFVDGRLHWLAEEAGRLDIVSLSLVEEKYGVVPWPENILPRHDSRLTLENLGGYLSLAIDESIWGMHVWVMKKYGEAKSWTKIWTLSDFVEPAFYNNVKPLWLMKNGDIALVFSVDSGSVVAVYDLANKVCKSRIDVVDSKIFKPNIYIESLVSPFGD